MKKIYFIIIQLLVSFSLFAQTKSINTETSKIKWTGREITTKIQAATAFSDSYKLIM